VLVVRVRGDAGSICTLLHCSGLQQLLSCVTAVYAGSLCLALQMGWLALTRNRKGGLTVEGPCQG
jgi:hypothetical protein